MSNRKAARRTILISAVAVLGAVAFVMLFPERGGPDLYAASKSDGAVSRAPKHAFGWYHTLKQFFTTFTVLLLTVLLITYVRIYREMRSHFALSLIMFTVALILYAVTSMPIMPILFGFTDPENIGPFRFLPEMFASFAVVFLLYQSNN
ncbi:hypothetical protein [Haloferax volcanii]|uniref:hypothetical protein n=1 Tax=Haloferax volcanii TaxID=2246 RepID=UPI0023DC72E6|nr:hypothetical protein [Haloferax lucentense]WEL27447.1 Uncharacterized protein SVXHx_3239 [Haloferax lucentense]